MEPVLETIGQLERRLNLSVPVADVESEVAKRLARLARNVKVPGFRPGKVPMKMVAQQYGPQVRTEVITDKVQAGFAEAMKSQNGRIAGYPRIEPRTDAAAADQLEFSAVFEVYPDIRLGDLSTVTIERPVAEVGPEDVQHTIEVLRKQRTRYKPVTRAAEAGDRVIVDFTGTIDGVEFPGGQAKEFAIVLGEGKMLPEFDAAVTGMSAGERKTFALTFPADYHGKEVAGRAAEFDLTVRSVSKAVLPPVDAEFAKAFGIASGSLRARRRDHSESQARAQAQDRGPVEGAGARSAPQQGGARAAALVGRDRSAEHGREDGRAAPPAGHEARGREAHARDVPCRRRGTRRARARAG
jgi:trigger factor